MDTKNRENRTVYHTHTHMWKTGKEKGPRGVPKSKELIIKQKE
jgi:hypothetical protein